MNLRVAFAGSPLGPWKNVSEPFTQKFTEGPCALKVGDDWLIYFDAYREKIYGCVKTRDFKTFTDATKEVSFRPDTSTARRPCAARSTGYLLTADFGTHMETEPPVYLLTIFTTSLAITGNAADATTNSPADDQVEANYTKTIEGRTADILRILALTDTNKAGHVHDAVMAQYRSLRAWHDENDAKLKAAKADTNAVAEIRGSLKVIHDAFLAKLAGDLSPVQVDQVKDKMTYGKVQFTF